ncbi:MAG: HEAT repeat domain-containing protein [Candidatus Woesearchaeota archaeon]
MPSIEQIVETGTVSLDSEGRVHREMHAFDEPLIAQEFLEAINNDEISVEDAYEHYWGYTVSKYKKEFRKYDNSDKLKILSLFWKRILLNMAPKLYPKKVDQITNFILEPYLEAKKISEAVKDYFLDRLYFAIKFKNSSSNKEWSNADFFSDQFIDELKNNEELSKPWKPDLMRNALISTLIDIGRPKDMDYIFAYLREHAGGRSTIHVTGELNGIRMENSKPLVEQTIERFKQDILKFSNRKVLEKPKYYTNMEDLIFDVWMFRYIKRKEAIPFLIDYLDTPETPSKDIAFYTLAEVGGAEIISEMKKQMNKRDSSERDIIIQALGKIDSDEVVDYLSELLNLAEHDYRDDWSNNEPKIIEALGMIKRDSSFRALVDYMAGGIKRYWSNAVESLWRTKQVVEYEGIAELLEEHLARLNKNFYNDLNRKYTFEILAKVGNDKSVSVLNEYIGNKEKPNRIAAVKALYENHRDICLDAAIPILIEEAIENGQRPRESYLKMFVELGKKEAMDELTKISQDKENPDQVKALEALTQIESYKCYR